MESVEELEDPECELVLTGGFRADLEPSPNEANFDCLEAVVARMWRHSIHPWAINHLLLDDFFLNRRDRLAEATRSARCLHGGGCRGKVPA